MTDAVLARLSPRVDALYSAIGRPSVGLYPDVPVLAAPVVALGAAAGVPPGPGVVVGGEIPYKPEAAAKKRDNAAHWLDRDPEVRCYMPGIPRAMYMPYPFQITQSATKIQMAFEVNAATLSFISMRSIHPPPTPGWALRSAAGTATRSSSTSITSTIARGCRGRETSTATP
jgi:hypothetical protein